MAQSTIPWPRKDRVRRRSTQPPRPSRRFPLWPLLSLPFLLFLSIPLLALFLRAAPDRLLTSLASPVVRQAVGLSALTTLYTVLLTIIFGTPVAYLLARYDFKLRRVVDTILDLPMVLPPAVAGVALLMAFGRRGLLGNYLDSLDLNIAFTQLAVVLAQTFVAAPFYIKAATIGFRSIEPDLEQAAALDGAGDRQVFRYITLPLSGTALLGGIVMTWARALGEFGATIIFAGNYPGRTQTMPLAIYIGFELELTVALTLSIILVGFSFLVLLLVKGVLRTAPHR